MDTAETMKTRIGTMLRSSAGTDGIVVPTCEPGAFNMVSILELRASGEPAAVITLHTKAALNEWTVNETGAKTGRVVIVADMEGLTGVPNNDVAVTPAEETGGVSTPEYADACHNMMIDVQMAVAGARAAGAQEIIVADCHWYDTNLHDKDFDVPVVRGSQAALSAMNGADAAILLGFHAKARSPNACLPHTYSDRVERLVIDGRELGEIGMLARLIASYDVPVVFVSGDFAAHLEVCQDVDGVKAAFTVVTKFVDEAGVVTHRQEASVRAEIAAGARLSVAKRHYRKELSRCFPGQFEVTVYPGFEVESGLDAERIPGDERTYRISGHDIRQSYANFQKFIDRLPVPGARSLAR